MKHLVILLLWVIPLVGKTHCIESFPIQDNFEEVSILLNGANVDDIYDICISSAGNGKNTLNISRTNHATISVYHDQITEIVYSVSTGKFQLSTNCGVFACFKTKNL